MTELFFFNNFFFSKQNQKELKTGFTKKLKQNHRDPILVFKHCAPFFSLLYSFPFFFILSRFSFLFSLERTIVNTFVFV